MGGSTGTLPGFTQDSFPRASRLTRQAEFRRVFARPNASQDRWFRVLARDNGLDRSRLGLAVSTRVSKRAVDRNRLKRVVRESFRQHQKWLANRLGTLDSGGGGIDIVVLPSRPAASMCNRTLAKALATHWERCAERALAERAKPKDRQA